MGGNKRQRPARAMGQLSASQGEDTSPTIVGGQPRARQGHKVNVPAGIERVLYLAAANPAFRVQLFKEREQAAARAGVSLSASERAMLRLAPEEQLAASIERLDISVENLERRSFLQAVAASAVTVAAAGAAGACSDDADVKSDSKVPADGYYPMGDAGIGVDITLSDKGPPMVDKGGRRPDSITPADTITTDTHSGSYGIQPDK